MSKRLHLDHAAIERLMEGGEFRRMVNAAADHIAEEVRSQGITVGDKDGGSHEYALPVKVSTYTSDRARATVLLAHPAGIAVQAKHGALSKAAAAVGLEINGE